MQMAWRHRKWMAGAMGGVALLAWAAQGEAKEEDHAAEASAEAAHMEAAKEIDPHDLGETVVTATRVEEPLAKVPASVTVITAKEMEKRQAFSLREALAREAGVYVSPTAETKDGLTLRGFSGKDVLVLYNGQQLNTAFDSSVNWDTIPMSEIERVEIVRGAGSSLYGGHAVAGVINIVTKAQAKDGALHGRAETKFGTNQTWQRSLSVTGGEGAFSFRLGYDARSSDGYAGYFSRGTEAKSGKVSAYGDLRRSADGRYIIGSRGAKKKESENVTLSLRYDISDARFLEYAYLHSDYKYNYHDPFTYLVDAAGHPTFSGIVDADGTLVRARYSDYLGYYGERGQDLHRLRYEDAKNRFKLSAGYSDVYKEGYTSIPTSAGSIDYQGPGARASYPSKNYNVDVQKVWPIGAHTLLLGGAWSKDEMEYTNQNLASWTDFSSVVGSPTMESGGSIVSSALFLQDTYAFAPKWELGLGIRYDRFDKKDGYSVAGGVRRDYADKRFTSYSPKLSLSYAPKKNALVFLSYGKSFNPPSIYKLFRRAGDTMSSVQANPNLTPETAKTYEIGYKDKVSGRFSYSATLFQIDSDDTIALATQGGVKAYYNMNRGRTKGAEIAMKYDFSHDWHTYLNYTYETGTLTSGGVTRDNYDIPRHMVHTGIEWRKGRWDVVLDGQYVSARQSADVVTGEYGSEDAFFTANFALNYAIEQNFKAQLAVSNLFDRTFYAGVAASGRTVTFGLSLDF